MGKTARIVMTDTVFDVISSAPARTSSAPRPTTYRATGQNTRKEQEIQANRYVQQGKQNMEGPEVTVAKVIGATHIPSQPRSRGQTARTPKSTLLRELGGGGGGGGGGEEEEPIREGKQYIRTVVAQYVPHTFENPQPREESDVSRYHVNPQAALRKTALYREQMEAESQTTGYAETEPARKTKYHARVSEPRKLQVKGEEANELTSAFQAPSPLAPSLLVKGAGIRSALDASVGAYEPAVVMEEEPYGMVGAGKRVGGVVAEEPVEPDPVYHQPTIRNPSLHLLPPHLLPLTHSLSALVPETLELATTQQLQEGITRNTPAAKRPSQPLEERHTQPGVTQAGIRRAPAVRRQRIRPGQQQEYERLTQETMQVAQRTHGPGTTRKKALSGTQQPESQQPSQQTEQPFLARHSYNRTHTRFSNVEPPAQIPSAQTPSQTHTGSIRASINSSARMGATLATGTTTETIEEPQNRCGGRRGEKRSQESPVGQEGTEGTLVAGSLRMNLSAKLQQPDNPQAASGLGFQELLAHQHHERSRSSSTSTRPLPSSRHQPFYETGAAPQEPKEEQPIDRSRSKTVTQRMFTANHLKGKLA